MGGDVWCAMMMAPELGEQKEKRHQIFLRACRAIWRLLYNSVRHQERTIYTLDSLIALMGVIIATHRLPVNTIVLHSEGQ